MRGCKVRHRFGDGLKNLFDGEALADDSGRHDKSAVRGWRVGQQPVKGCRHASSILEPAFSCDGICAAGVDYYGSDTLTGALLKDISTNRDRGGLKYVLREHSCRGCWPLRRQEREVREACVGRFYAHVGARNEESFGVRACRRDIFLFRGRDRPIYWGGVMPHLPTH